MPANDLMLTTPVDLPLVVAVGAILHTALVVNSDRAAMEIATRTLRGPKEIAAILHISPKTVEIRIIQARNKLAEALVWTSDEDA